MDAAGDMLIALRRKQIRKIIVWDIPMGMVSGIIFGLNIFRIGYWF